MCVSKLLLCNNSRDVTLTVYRDEELYIIDALEWKKKKGKMIIREDDELVCQKSCPLVNDKKSNVRAARAPIREEKEESQE